MERTELSGVFESAQGVSSVVLPSPTVDEYREYLDEFELTEEQKLELLQTLWWIMVSFVDIGFGIDSVQRCLPALEEMTLASEENELEQSVHTQNVNGAGANGKEQENDHEG